MQRHNASCSSSSRRRWAVEWKQPPAVHGQTLEGSVVVSNLTAQDVTLTVIVMAVNQIGRATALGYQEFTLRSGAQQVIPFGSSPGPGTYIVHADAVAEVASTNTIYRARKQTVDPLVIESPRVGPTQARVASDPLRYEYNAGDGLPRPAEDIPTDTE